jgi:hypothetical protein
MVLNPQNILDFIYFLNQVQISQLSNQIVNHLKHAGFFKPMLFV